MERTRLSTKGQVILPKELRITRAWGPGTEFTIEETRDGILLRPVRPFPPVKLEDVAGCLPWRGKAKTIAEMDAAVARRFSRTHARDRH
jgi:AbrB family looped-hinge helix DNA binding protein